MKKPVFRALLATTAGVSLVAGGVLFTSCVTSGPASKPVTLKDAYAKYFRVGVAINRSQAVGDVKYTTIARTPEQLAKEIALIKTQFNQLSPENDLKWEVVQPYEGPKGYNFAPSDAYVNFGVSNHMYIVGHNLVWHSQVPGWVFQASNSPPPDGWVGTLDAVRPGTGGRRGVGGGGFGGGGFGGGFGRGGGGPSATRDQVLQRLHDHIATVVGHYKGKIAVWDVVNEAIDDGGTNILRQSQWTRIVGPDFIAKAFEYAHEADPKAILRYNDYSLENSAKRHKLIALIKSLQAEHVPVMAIGSQTHVSVSSPGFAGEDQTLTELATLGLPIHITEFDVNGAAGGQRSTSGDVAGNAAVTQGGLVDNANQRLGDAYAALFRAFVKHADYVKMVTFWGVDDTVSWRAQGRPLLFDGETNPKYAFDAVMAVATNSPATK